jgi:2-polyprenyl-6-hydroxyphenyl methylase/3-demethylubiquinone-9 3-methyltransferase
LGEEVKMSLIEKKRFEFGKNWIFFVERDFSRERCEIAKSRLLAFAGLKTLQGYRFLDVGCGSGIHSLAAVEAGAEEVYSFDCDPNSVAATKLIKSKRNLTDKWTVEVGDALNTEYLTGLGKWNFVYSWGVLHHTGSMWEAIKNVQDLVEDEGLFYLALYSKDADFQPSKEFWIEIKQEYIRSKPLTRKMMGWWYVWRFIMGERFKNIFKFIERARDYKKRRGMSIMRDIHDWIGGWPMEYAGDQETVDFLEERYGFKLVNVDVGQACSEFLFKKTGEPGKKTEINDFRNSGS